MTRPGAWPDGRPRALAFLPRFLFRSDWPAWRYVLFAWPVVSLPSLLLGWLTTRLLPDLPGPDLGHAPAVVVAVGVALFSPFVETLLMTGPVALIDRFAGPVPAVWSSALLWGVLHSLSAARWGLVIWWPFLVFSIAYLTWRARGYWQAVGVVFAIHALNNTLPVIAVLLGG